MKEYTITNKTFNKVTGDSGEQLAKEYLKKNGYKILKTNYKTNIGEIDIIAKQKDFIVFVEVKTRKNDYFGLPREAVNSFKQQKIRQVATQYIKFNKLFDASCRFDVIEILGDEISHLENCFWVCLILD